MHQFLLPLHVTATSLVVGTLFLNSLMVVMAMRLKGEAQRDGVRIVQRRVHLFIYQPIMVVAVLTGLWLAVAGGVFSDPAGGWLHLKLVVVVLLAGLGLAIGHEIRTGTVPKGMAMAVHIGVFLLSLWIVYLAVVKPG